MWIYIIIWAKGISPASNASWYTETQLWILFHFHTDLKHTHIHSFYKLRQLLLNNFQVFLF